MPDDKWVIFILGNMFEDRKLDTKGTKLGNNDIYRKELIKHSQGGNVIELCNYSINSNAREAKNGQAENINNRIESELFLSTMQNK